MVKFVHICDSETDCKNRIYVTVEPVKRITKIDVEAVCSKCGKLNKIFIQR